MIIPFLEENDDLFNLLASLSRQLWPGEEIVAVMGKADRISEELQLSSKIRMCFSPKGRGIQLNEGARKSRGDILWFLHADSTPPANFAYHVWKILNNPENVLGCFELAFSTSSATLELIARWANCRTKYLKLPYGDQGLFCTQKTFSKAGGFRKRYLMEDVDFVRTCKKLGKLLVVQRKLYSSPERYIKKGPLKASLQNHLIMVLYQLGVSESKLYELYYR